jgi:hypothetical protein
MRPGAVGARDNLYAVGAPEARDEEFGVVGVSPARIELRTDLLRGVVVIACRPILCVSASVADEVIGAGIAESLTALRGGCRDAAALHDRVDFARHDQLAAAPAWRTVAEVAPEAILTLAQDTLIASDPLLGALGCSGKAALAGLPEALYLSPKSLSGLIKKPPDCHEISVSALVGRVEGALIDTGTDSDADAVSEA